ncbi:MAG: thioredoxin [Ideonella sp. MAG2]|nr:MAG: thioredoxin [Ideonella sp. MAG2]
MDRRRHLASSASLLATACLGGWALPGCSSRESAPDVAVTLLDGSSHQMAAQKGKVTLINFWATSCTSCVKEMPELVSTFEKYKAQGYQTYAVAMSYDTPAFVSNFAQTRQLPFHVAMDSSGAVAKAFGDVRLTPTSILMDKQARIVKRYVGPPDFAAMQKLIEELLAA